MKALVKFGVANGKPLGSMELVLFSRTYPRTVANFVGLARQHLAPPADSAPPQLLGSKVWRILPGDRLEFGPSATQSFFGPLFEDEPPVAQRPRIHRYGTVSMCNVGPNTNGAKFFICLREAAPDLDGSHVVLGRVQLDDPESAQTLQLLSQYPTCGKGPQRGQPHPQVRVIDCGVSERTKDSALRLSRGPQRRARDELEDGDENDEEPAPKRLRTESTSANKTSFGRKKIAEVSEKSVGDRFADATAAAEQPAEQFNFFEAQRRVYDWDISDIAARQQERRQKRARKLRPQRAPRSRARRY